MPPRCRSRPPSPAVKACGRTRATPSCATTSKTTRTSLARRASSARKRARLKRARATFSRRRRSRSARRAGAVLLLGGYTRYYKELTPLPVIQTRNHAERECLGNVLLIVPQNGYYTGFQGLV